MIGVLSLLLVVTLSLFVTRIASMALMLTGLSRDLWRCISGSSIIIIEFSGAHKHWPIKYKVTLSYLFQNFFNGIIDIIWHNKLWRLCF